ncbi:MAG: hypothetical protein ABIH42_10130, partial [Planctomycetota bacterium]
MEDFFAIVIMILFFVVFPIVGRILKEKQAGKTFSTGGGSDSGGKEVVLTELDKFFQQAKKLREKPKQP